MAKKKKSPPKSVQQYPGVHFTSEVIRHVNEQVLGVAATTAVAEAIPTPGYSEVGYSGAFIVGAQLSPKPGVNALITAALQQYVCQLQVGDRTAAPALLNPNDVGFFAQRVQCSTITTSGAVVRDYPVPIPISMPVPIIVMPHITICHDCTVDEANHAGETVYVEIFYRTVRLDDRAYAGLLLQQQRTS
jgi:hypothetical protein